jgi:hypothetical protein
MKPKLKKKERELNFKIFNLTFGLVSPAQEL